MTASSVDQDPDITATERAIWETAHRFAKDVMRPAGIQLDKLPATEVIAADSILWNVVTKYQALGFHLIDDDPQLSPNEKARIRCLIGEELGWGDAGLAISFGCAGFPTVMAKLSGNPALIERFPPGTLGCWAITEPDHGSDMVSFDGALSHPGGKRSKPNCLARRVGDEFVISGQKSAWVSNGTFAEAAALFCAVDMGDGKIGGGVFVISLKDPAVKRGKPTDKIGQRALNQGEIFFEDLRVPADSLVIPPEAYTVGMESVLTMANSGMGTTFVGCARAAFELAVDYAKQRVQGDTVIFSHQSVKARLFKMYRSIEAARALNQRVVRIGMNSMMPILEMAVASKVTSTQAAFDVASDALQIFGGAGITRECPIEKIFRDARISMIEDGCNEVLGLVAANKF